MYECPNCNANLKFDIPSQKLLCDHCGTMMDPYAFQKEKDAEELTVAEALSDGSEQEYEVTVYICPQCGGKLIGDDTTAATFCNYCGGSTILDRHISRERRPAYIIPFQKTREDCEQAYAQMMRGAVFAPGGMKRKQQIAKFRGIYMPYWMYTAEKDEKVVFSASQQRQSGDYKIINLFKLHSRILAKYRGFHFDASAAFSDSLSEAVSPFDWKAAQPFTAAFLSGFYADAEDVGADVFREDVEQIVSDDICRHIEADPTCQNFKLGGDLGRVMRPNKMDVKLAMFPVWFLAYRYKDRVSYAVMNGQTGKIAGDIPVSKARYLFGSMLLAVPIFFLLNLIISVRASTMLFLTGILAIFSIYISLGQRKRLQIKEENLDIRRGGKYRGTENAQYEGKDIDFWGLIGANAISLLVLACVFLLDTRGILSSGPFLLAMFVLKKKNMLNMGFRKLKDRKIYVELSNKDKLITALKPGLGLFLALMVLAVRPASDWFYYIAAGIVMLLIVWNMLDLLDMHNRMLTRPVPQFGRRGGEADGR